MYALKLAETPIVARIAMGISFLLIAGIILGMI